MCEALERYFNRNADEEWKKMELYTEWLRSWENLLSESIDDYVHRFKEMVVDIVPNDAYEMDMIIIFRKGLPARMRAMMDFPLAIPDIHWSMSTMLHVLQHTDPPMEPVAPAAEEVAALWKKKKKKTHMKTK